MYHLAFFGSAVLREDVFGPRLAEQLLSPEESAIILFQRMREKGDSRTVRRIHASDILQTIQWAMWYGTRLCIICPECDGFEPDVRRYEIGYPTDLERLENVFRAISKDFEWALLPWPAPSEPPWTCLLLITASTRIFDAVRELAGKLLADRRGIGERSLQFMSVGDSFSACIRAVVVAPESGVSSEQIESATMCACQAVWDTCVVPGGTVKVYGPSDLVKMMKEPRGGIEWKADTENARIECIYNLSAAEGASPGSGSDAVYRCGDCKSLAAAAMVIRGTGLGFFACSSETEIPGVIQLARKRDTEEPWNWLVGLEETAWLCDPCYEDHFPVGMYFASRSGSQRDIFLSRFEGRLVACY